MIYRLLFITLLVTAVSGCASAVTSGITGLGYSIAQERTVGDAIDDVTIGTKIDSYYIRQGNGKLFRNVAVEVHEGRVLLTGNVEAPEDRVEAVKLAWQAKGVKEVINEIQVNQPSSIQGYANDVWITTQVRSRLFLEREVKSINYSVDTVNGIVYLMGVAQNKEELRTVEYVASTVEGVQKVISHVRMKG